MLLSEACRRRDSRQHRPCRDRRKIGQTDLSRHREPRRPDRDGSDRGARTPPLGFDGPQARNPGPDHVRPRPRYRAALAACDRGGDRDARDAARHRPQKLRENDRRQRSARRRADCAESSRLGSGQGIFEMGRGAVRRRLSRPLHLEHGKTGARRAHLYRLSAQQPRRDRDRRLFAAGAAGRPGRDAAVLGGGRERRQTGPLHYRDRAGAAGRARGPIPGPRCTVCASR